MKTLFKNATLVNEGKITVSDLLIDGEFISIIAETINSIGVDTVIDATGLYLLPGMIDDQVHFREPGLTHKGDIFTESRAAAAGGITTFIEQPNTVPNAVTQEILEEKYMIGAEKSMVNYSFMMGATNDNLDEVLKTNPANVAGIKIFLGSSTGNMLVDNEATLEKIFSSTKLLIAVHCEDETTIRKNLAEAKEKFGDNIPVEQHPIIRSAEACYISSSKAVELAKKTGAKLHVFHLSTAKEMELFRNDIPLSEKKITAEVCIHHLIFSDEDYPLKGNFIKWNPAVKTKIDREALWKALLDDRIDVIATDHAPHTLEEKSRDYLNAPSGGPLVQHALVALFEEFTNGKISIEKIVEKVSHNPAILFQIDRRGYLREGYFADIVLIDPKKPQTVDRSNILYKCGWSPFEGSSFSASVVKTFVNGKMVYDNGKIAERTAGMRLAFNR